MFYFNLKSSILSVSYRPAHALHYMPGGSTPWPHQGLGVLPSRVRNTHPFDSERMADRMTYPNFDALNFFEKSSKRQSWVNSL